MTLFNEICKRMFDYFQQSGSPGISGIGDAGECWIFIEASGTSEGTDYGSRPVFVDKNSGEARYMDWFSGHDWELHDAAKKIDVPKEYQPVYAIRQAENAVQYNTHCDEDTKVTPFEELMQKIEQYNELFWHGKEWEKLRDRILSCKEPDEILQVYEDTKKFFKSNAPEEEKDALGEYMECLLMLLDAILPDGYNGEEE